MKFAIYTLGCKVNIFESESIAQLFTENGYERVDFNNQAQIYIINTCTVTNTSDSKSRKIIRQAIRRNPNSLIVVIGCYAQVKSDEIIKISGVDLVIGNDSKSEIFNIVNNYINNPKNKVYVENIMEVKDIDSLSVDTYLENTRAFLKIQDGCNNFCSFCIIPYARGLMRSKSKENVLSEVKQLVANGYKEIVLTGIHTGGYGEDFENYNFSDLVSDIINVDGTFRVRISSIEINQIDDKLLNLLSSSNKLSKHLHIPIQSASNEVLKSMRRKYSVEKFVDKINYIRSKVENIAITTDIIIGYPNETNELFNETFENCKLINFSDMHVFPYSVRDKTPAANMKQVDEIIKKERMKIMLKLKSDLKEVFYKSQIGIISEIIVEEISQEYSQGKTSNYTEVRVDSQCRIGDFIKVEISSYENEVCYAKVYK